MDTNDYEFECKGRSADGHSVLKEAVHASVTVGVNEVGRGIYSFVHCPYANSLGNQCSASKGKKGMCPSALDLKVI